MRRNRSGNKNRNPFVRMILGVLVILGALMLLWQNEGRVNLADVAVKSTPVSAETIEPTNEGEFVSVTGRLETAVPVNDSQYLRPAEFVQINRWVEMYAWVEDEESNESDTTYSYELAWTDDPPASETFYNPDGHTNPPLTIDEATFTAVSATIGSFKLNPQQIELPRPEPLPLSLQNVQEGPYKIREAYLFEGKGTLDNPELGDVRISFTVVPANITVTAFGTQTGSDLTSYYHRDKIELYRVVNGVRGQAIEQLNTEYKFLLWGFRVFGTGLMWVGLGLLVSPLTALLQFIPLLGNLGRKAIGALTLVLALLLSGVTIIVSAIAHNIWALFIILLLIAGGFYLWREQQTAKNE